MTYGILKGGFRTDFVTREVEARRRKEFQAYEPNPLPINLPRKPMRDPRQTIKQQQDSKDGLCAQFFNHHGFTYPLPEVKADEYESPYHFS